jgi:hypothetical protein
MSTDSLVGLRIHVRGSRAFIEAKGARESRRAGAIAHPLTLHELRGPRESCRRSGLPSREA